LQNLINITPAQLEAFPPPMRAQIQQLATIVRGSVRFLVASQYLQDDSAQLSNPEAMVQLVATLRSVAPGLFGGM
jgi:hypothetical protein